MDNAACDAIPSIGNLDLLFRPFPFGRRTLRNRVAMAPMTRNHSPGGVPGEDVAAYYLRRAKGGAGLIITEGTYIDHPAANGYRNVPAFHGVALEGWVRIVAQIHAAGAAIIPQLWHVGAVRRSGMEPVPAVSGVGPMAIEEGGVRVVEALDARGIEDVARSYARAARDAEALGFDGVEIHGAHGYLLDQFLWDRSNQRGDAYGGSSANRVRFAVETIAAIRAEVSADFPIVFRFSQWKMSDYSARIAESADELAELLQPLAEAGVDIFHTSTRRFWEPAFDGSDETLAACARRTTGLPVIGVGSAGLAQPHQTRKLRTAENVQSEVANLDRLVEAMARDEFDLIAVGRAMLADAEWADKIARGELASLNRLDERVLEELD